MPGNFLNKSLYLILLTLFGCSTIPIPIQNINNGNEHYYNGNYSEAIHCYSENYQYYDENRIIYLLNIASARWQNSDFDNAAKLFLEIVKINDSYENSASVLKPKESRKYRLEPFEIAMVHNLLGVYYYNINNYEKAKIELKNSINEHKDIALSHYLLGRTYLASEEYAEAIIEFIWLIETCPNFPYSYYEMAKCIYHLENDMVKAEDYLEKFVILVDKFHLIANPELNRIKNDYLILLDINTKTNIILNEFSINWEDDKFIEQNVTIGQQHWGKTCALGIPLQKSFKRAVKREVWEQIKSLSLDLIIPDDVNYSAKITSEYEGRKWDKLTNAVGVCEIWESPIFKTNKLSRKIDLRLR